MPRRIREKRSGAHANCLIDCVLPLYNSQVPATLYLFTGSAERPMQADDTFTADAILESATRALQAEPGAVEKTDDGVHWWPGSHRVTLSCAPERFNAERCFKLTMTTRVLRDVTLTDEKTTDLITVLCATSPTYAWLAPATLDLRDIGKGNACEVAMRSSIRVLADNVSWAPQLLARLAILQPIDAERIGAEIAKITGATDDTEPRRSQLNLAGHDPVLDIAETLLKPEGEKANHWTGSEEFKLIAEKLGRNEMCFGAANDTGVTLETPFGRESAAVNLDSQVPHPGLGTGLLTTIYLPISIERARCSLACYELNARAARPGAPVGGVFGSWHPRQAGDGWGPAYGAFVPNALYGKGVAANMALWAVGLAQWAKSELWSHVVNEPMSQILGRRASAQRGST